MREYAVIPNRIGFGSGFMLASILAYVSVCIYIYMLSVSRQPFDAGYAQNFAVGRLTRIFRLMRIFRHVEVATKHQSCHRKHTVRTSFSTIAPNNTPCKTDFRTLWHRTIDMTHQSSWMYLCFGVVLWILWKHLFDSGFCVSCGSPRIYSSPSANYGYASITWEIAKRYWMLDRCVWNCNPIQ